MRSLEATRETPRPDRTAAFGLGIAVFVAALVPVSLTGPSFGASGIWLANGLLLARLLRPGRSSAALVGLLAITAAALVHGQAPSAALALGACNLAEVLFASWMVRAWVARQGARLDLSRSDNVTHFVPCALVAPLLSGGLAMALHASGRFEVWYLGHVLGLIVTVPVVSRRWSDVSQSLLPSREIEVWLYTLLASGGSAALILLHHEQWLFAVVPFVMLAACRAGFAGTAATAAGAMLAGLAATSIASPLDPRDTVLLLQLFFLANVFTALPVSALLESTTSSQRALRQQIERYDDLAARLPVGVYTLHMPSEGPMRFDYASPVLGRILGVPVEEILRDLGAAYRNCHEEEMAALQQQVATARDSLQPFDWEGRFVVGGEVRWIRIESVPTPTPSGGSLWDGVVTDLTDRKLAEEALLCHLKLREMEETATPTELLQFAVDEAERLTGSSIGFFHLIEEDQQTLTAQTWSSNTLRTCAVEGDLRHLPVTEGGAWAECVRSRRPVVHNDYLSLPSRKGHPPGHAHLVRELIVPVADAKVRALLAVGNRATAYDNRHVAIVSNLAEVAWEITTRKASQKALMESEHLLKALVDASPLAIVTYRADGTPVMANASAASLVGAALATVLQQNFRDLASWKPAGLLDAADCALASGLPQTIDTVATTSFGNTRWLCAHFVPFAHEGQPHLLLVAEDISQRKQHEAELKAYAETQAVLLREVNHRVANNLAAILAIVHLEECRAEADGLSEAAEILSVLENRVQSLSMVHTLLASGEWRPVGLRGLCTELVLNALMLDDTRRMRVTEDGPPVLVQAEQAHCLALVLSELATNSLKYGRDMEGGPRSRSTSCATAARSRSPIAITDRASFPRCSLATRRASA